MNDKQFEDAFTAAGGWFMLTQFDLISNWKGSKTDLIDFVFTKGFDSKRSGTNTRVSSVIRILENNRGKEAILKIRDSVAINRKHPDANNIANSILTRYFI